MPLPSHMRRQIDQVESRREKAQKMLDFYSKWIDSMWDEVERGKMDAGDNEDTYRRWQEDEQCLFDSLYR